MITQPYLPRNANEYAHIYNFISDRIRDFQGPEAHQVIASVRGGDVIGGVIYHDYRGRDISLSCAGDPGWLSKSMLAVYFNYPFLELNCRRITTIVHRRNKIARKFNERLGFTQEGVHRAAMPDGRDAISFGMIRKDCIWLKESPYHGKEQRRSENAYAA